MKAPGSVNDRVTHPAHSGATPDTDAMLVDRIATGDRTALEQVYRMHGRVVFAAAFGPTRRRGLAEEAAQEVFVRLWKRPERYDPARGSLRSFLKVDARGRAIDALRSERARRDREDREGQLQSSARHDGIEEMVMSRITSLKVRELLSELRPEERVPLALAYFDGHSYRAVAHVLGLPEGTVKSRIRSGLGRLRDLVAASGIEPA